MMRKFLLAAFLAAFAVAGTAVSADFYVGGGGGGGGGAGKADADKGGTGGAGGGASSDGATSNDSGKGGNGGAGGSTGGTGGAGGGAGAGSAGTNGTAGGTSGGDTGTPDPTIGVVGGAGDDLTKSSVSITNGLTVLGGEGGAGGGGVTTVAAGGAGGRGGNVNLTLADGTGSAAIAITGGKGGDGGVTDTTADGAGGVGGAGGNVIVTAGTLTLSSGADLTITGGDGGDGTNVITPVLGGKGGNVTFTATKVTLDDTEIDVSSGAAGTDGGAGGDVAVNIGTLAAGATGGSFTTANSTGDGAIAVTLGAIEAVDGDLAFDFTGTTTLSVTGDITVGDGRALDVDGMALSTANGWTGQNLNVLGRVTLGGLNLAGKNVLIDTTALPDSFEIDGTALITEGGAQALNVAADTKVSLKVNNAQKTDLMDGTDDLVVFDAATDDLADLEGAEFTIYNGAEEAKAVFDAAGSLLAADAAALVFGVNASDEGIAYNALLAAPALMSLVNGGADVVEKVTGSFSPMAFTNSGMQFGVFADIGAASMDVDTGSNVDSDSFHMLIGPGLRINNGTGKTDFGAFFEAGWGSYDAFSGIYRGDGDTEYYGGGLLLRHDTCFGLYAEASLRAGGADTDYNNRDGLDTNYEMNASYVGGHLGLGYILRPTECTSWDFFAKGILTSVSGESAQDTAGNTITVDDTTSFRTQLGAKYSYNFAQNAAFYVKGAWEHEFDGETGGAYSGVRIAKNADTSGSSLIGELGVDVRLAERVTLGASVYGITGQRDGFGGNLNIGIGF